MGMQRSQRSPMMPSQRRARVLFYLVLAAVVTTLLFTSHLRKSVATDPRSLQDFYHKTVKAMEKQGRSTGPSPNDGLGQTFLSSVDDDENDDMARAMAARLRAAEQQAKDSANAKAPRPDSPSKVNGVGSSAEGQKKGALAVAGAAEDAAETQEEEDVETELNTILKKAPVIIFSKSTCPHCKRAKALLLDKYDIDPAPYVVELDKHPLGKPIHAKLAGMTGRRTVPNIMVNGKSIGGADDVVALDQAGELVGKIESLSVASGTRRLRVTERAAPLDEGALSSSSGRRGDSSAGQKGKKD